MHVALLANTAWLDEELSSFHALAAALHAAGVQLTQIVPDALPADEASPLAARVPWHDGRFPAARRFRLFTLAAQLEKTGLDVLHALDGRLWEGALKLAERLKVPAILSTSSLDDVPKTERWREAAVANKALFSATTAPLAEAIAGQLGGGFRVPAIVPGVVAPAGAALPAAPARRPGAASLALAVSGTLDDDTDALLAGLYDVLAAHPQVQCFLDTQMDDAHAVWQAARRYGLSGHLSLVPRRLGHRDLLLEADLLVQPQALGRSRGLTLAAMGRGLAVVARTDPWLDYLIEGETARLVDQPDPARWAEAIGGLVDSPAPARALGERARQWVLGHHALSATVAATLDLYRRAAGAPLKFPQAG